MSKGIKKFKRGVMESGHLQELRERQTYTKPKTVRRKQKLQAIREQNKLTILEKIENGDTKVKLFSKKRKKRKGSPKQENKNKSNKN